MIPDDRQGEASLAAASLERLDSWKDIAAYLGRSVLTVQRWEKSEGLPVHRHTHAKQASVYAFRSEIDRWRRARDVDASSEAEPREPGRADVVVHRARFGHWWRTRRVLVSGTAIASLLEFSEVDFTFPARRQTPRKRCMVERSARSDSTSPWCTMRPVSRI